MSEETKTTSDADFYKPDWGGLAAEAEQKVNEAIEQLCNLLTTKNRIELLGRVATYILFPPGGSSSGREHSQTTEVNLEYLCSLATALPGSPSSVYPSANDIQTTIELLATVHVQSSLFHSAYKNSIDQEAEALSDLSASFQLQKLHVRGDGYWHHLKQTWHDIMRSHDEVFRRSIGFSFSDYLNLAERLEAVIEERINQESDQKIAPYRDLLRPWIGELSSGKPLSKPCQDFLHDHDERIEAARAAFDAFGSSESFLIGAVSQPEKELLASLSCTFGENAVFTGARERYRFWPLNETLTDKKPFIQDQGRFYAFNFSKIGRNAYECTSHAFRELSPKYYQTQFLPGRDTYLEEETTRILQKALPAANILTAAFYPLRAGGRAEADIVIVMDDVLIVVECKAGTITPAAKRGAPLRVKTDVQKTIGEGLNQAERLVRELVDHGELSIQSKKSGKLTLKAEDFRWVFRINVTLDLISAVASSIWSLTDIGLVDSTERCWSVSLNDLRVVVEILDRPPVFLHYLIRRFDTSQLRTVEAADELDYMMYYVHQGLFFRGKNTLKEHEHLTIIGYTEDLDRYYRRLQGQTDKGPKPRIALGAHTERLMDLLEKWRPKNWMTGALQFLEFDRPGREILLGKIHSQFKKIRERRSNFAFSFLGCSENRTAIALVCAKFPEVSKEMVRARCISRCMDYGFDSMVVIVVGMPVAANAPIILCVSSKDSAPEDAKRLLAQLRFDVTKHEPKESRPGIFDGIREDEGRDRATM